MLIAEREVIKPVLGMDWQPDLNRTIRHFEMLTTTNDQSERDEIITRFEKLSKSNQTLKDTENETQKRGAVYQQNRRLEQYFTIYKIISKKK